ncbi:MAG: hypothetical protein ACPGVU_08730 [Limisphaerales bacterium]
MLKRTTLLTLATCALLVAPFSANAQRPSRGGFGGQGSMPRVGETMPDVSAFDSNGKPFSLRQKTKGRHAVIVFGCLT